MKQMLLFIPMLTIVVFLLGFTEEENNINYERAFQEKMLVSDYEGAKEVAKRWDKSVSNHWPAVNALANAYIANFEPKKAHSVVVKFVKEVDYKDKNIVDGYIASAKFDCVIGNYDRAFMLFKGTEENYPRAQNAIQLQKYICSNKKLSSDLIKYKLEYDSYKREVSEYLVKTRDDFDYNAFSKAILAYYVTKNTSLAQKFAADGLMVAGNLAEKTFKDRTKISSRYKAFAATFFALNGDREGAFRILGFKPGYNVDDLLRKGWDPFYLGKFLVVVDDISSANKCFKALWQRMKTDEQKEQFFKNIVDDIDKDSVWRVMANVDWIKQKYTKFKNAKRNN